MQIQIGEVISIRGIKIVLKIFDDSNKDTIFYNGEKYKGVSIREYLRVQRGFIDIICMVEGEYLDEASFENKSTTPKYIRRVEIKPIGFFQNGIFTEGIKYLPMIKDPAYLVTEEKIAQIYSRETHNSFIIGKMLKENLPISLPWQKLFNSHIGIFGNTGSGKSNTLTKLYTLLFSQKKDAIRNRSRFVLIDFNGEYTRDQLIPADDKIVYNLDTSSNIGSKFPMSLDDFWNSEVLSILFKATESTQKPFLNRMLKGREKFIENPGSLNTYARSTFKKAFTSKSPKRESIELLRQVLRFTDGEELEGIFNTIQWHGSGKFYIPPNTYFNGDDNQFNQILSNAVSRLTFDNLDTFDELIVRINLQLINDLIGEYVQFDFIQPLLKRIESSNNLRRVIHFPDGEIDEKILTVISLRKCNQEVKKILPLLVAKHLYHSHKNIVNNPPDKTVHLIIDEAHNILSQQSNREQESWKDYRLELFEEIIKEGRKFGMYLTISSQRPADISPTIMSQIHNFFVHRLVNEKDLLLLNNSISTLDTLSKEMIPHLSTGSCIVTGTSFELPFVMQVAKLADGHRPDSEDVNLEELWRT
jgi:DNA helicase HerA-like ATPase